MNIIHQLCILVLFAQYSVSFEVLSEWRSSVGCISWHEVKPIINKKKELSGSTKSIVINTSINLGYSAIDIILNEDGLSTTENKLLASWKELDTVMKKKSNCFALFDDGSIPWQISTISESSGFPVSLLPPLDKSGAPTIVLGGFTMHRISGDSVNPMVDTANKASTVPILPGNKVLDTCTGLGYTAIAAAQRSAGRVITCEIDTASLEMAAYNPWSQELFNRANDPTSPIEIIVGNTCDTIKKFPDNYFDVILHDPPARAICKEDLYAQTFYNELHRVLKKPYGKLFHYIGNPTSKESGRLFKGVKERLQVSGFRNIQIASLAFGMTADL